MRILETLTAKGAEAKTALSLDTKLNYTRLAKHIVWMEKRGLVQSKINKGKVKVVLTKEGKEFTSILSKK